MKFITCLLLSVSMLAYAQAPTVTPPATPTVATADTAPPVDLANTTALKACEQAKVAAQTAFRQASMTEAQIINTWETANPGYTISLQTFAATVKVAPAPRPMPVRPALTHPLPIPVTPAKK
jgi:hypothetical protein